MAKNNDDLILKKLNDIENNQKLIKQEMKLRFESVDKRFEMLNDNMNKSFEIFINFMMALTTGIFGLIGFMMWNRRISKERVCKRSRSF